MHSRITFDLRVLSAPTALVRRQRVEIMMGDRALDNWAFFDVLPAEDLHIPYDAAAAYAAYGSAMSPGEISCAASHIGMLKAFCQTSKADYLIVVEDDVAFDPHFEPANAVEFMAATHLNYLKLYARYFVPAKYISGLGRVNVYRTSWPALGTQCYILSRSGAAQMLSSIDQRGRLIYPIDACLDRYWETGLPVVMTYPFPLMELSLPTTIHDPANRLKIDEANEALRATIGASPTFRHKTSDRLNRFRANRRLGAFDASLAQTINDDREHLHGLLNGQASS